MRGGIDFGRGGPRPGRRQLIVRPLGHDLTPLAGHHRGRLAPVLRRLDQAMPVRNGAAHSDVARACPGLRVQGKSDAAAARAPLQRSPTSSSSASAAAFLTLSANRSRSGSMAESICDVGSGATP